MQIIKFYFGICQKRAAFIAVLFFKMRNAYFLHSNTNQFALD